MTIVGIFAESYVDAFAKLLHESGRAAVEAHKVVNDLGKPFLEWEEISEDAREGRRMMARFLLDRGVEFRP